MVYGKVSSPRLSAVVEQRLESLIVDGKLKPGEKLLSERELAAKFGVSRPSIREAIQRLEARNLLIRRQGNGTFVNAELMQEVRDPLLALVINNPDSQFDLLETRYSLEGMAAYFAALRGTNTDFDKIALCHQHIIDTQDDRKAEARAVFDYLTAIVTASHNTILLHIVNSLEAALVSNILQVLELLYTFPKMSKTLKQYRKCITKMILAREPEKARDASHKHLAFIENVLLTYNHTHNRKKPSLRRLD